MQRFNFNLLPQKSKKVLEKEDERESRSLWIAFLPLIAILITIGMILFNNLVIKNNVRIWENALSDRENRLVTYRSNLERNLEFVTKTDLLANPVQKDVEPERFFSLTEELLSTIEFRADVKKYGRNSDGSFDITFITDSLDYSGDLLYAFENMIGIKAASLRSVNVNLTDYSTETVVNFFVAENDIETG